MEVHLYRFFRSRSKSAVSAANFALATVLFGCMTMSHPAGISSRWQRTISRRRRRIRFRTTAPPSFFLMLNPNRLCGCSLARKKTVKWELERRFPARYTASNSDFRTSRASRGNVAPSGSAPGGVTGLPALFGGKPMASLLAARRQHPAAAFRLHARAKPVRLGTSALARLKCALWQSNPPLSFPVVGQPVSHATAEQSTSLFTGSFRIYGDSLPRLHIKIESVDLSSGLVG